MSDLHLEVGQQYASFHITPRAPYLILAGNIGQLADYDAYRDFLSSQCENFEAVYLVLGNHEFFGVTRQEGLRRADMLQEEPQMKGKLVIMNRKRIDFDYVTLLGCTLHSRIPPESEELVGQKIDDFRCILNWTVADHNAEHTKDTKWLMDEIKLIKGKGPFTNQRIMVISHHAPLTKWTCKPSEENSPLISASATDLLTGEERLCFCLGVQRWIFGHTQYTTELDFGTRLTSNQRGSVAQGVKASLTSRVVGLGDRFRKHTFNVDKVIHV
ncbi:hypothetical protein FQN49_005019 [Arthroderma sp. PD_2]|nr:hypothetical protein FQN49_005019 [Arthroderma sp. PD_2]